MGERLETHRLKARPRTEYGERLLLRRPKPPSLRQASRLIWVLAFVLCLASSQRSMASESQQPIPIAVIDFDYSDTSGEAHDLTAEHRTQLQGFMDSIRGALTADEKYRLVAVSCGGGPCSLSRSTPPELVNEAKRAGARLLLYGGVHKESTLVQWAKVQVVDIEDDKLVFDRWLSFRGDTDEAWRRAESFVAKELEKELSSK